ncbi:hypothetical protein GOV04_05195 [Candidatus Woesearchaeota archaeon]|nr:hypothetical protein [Candidatus Woesearchaeota archaeon]
MLEELLNPVREVFLEHRPTLMTDYGLDLVGYTFKTMNQRLEEVELQVMQANTFWEKLACPDLQRTKDYFSKTKMAIAQRKKTIYVNTADFNLSLLFEEPQTINQVEAYAFCKADLSLSLIHECFHTLIPVIDTKEQFTSSVRPPPTNKLALGRWIIRGILLEKALRRLPVEEAIVEMCTLHYLGEHAKKTRIASDQYDGLEFIKESLFATKLENILAITTKHYLEDDDEQSKAFQALHSEYENNGFDAVINAIKNPQTLEKLK